MIRRPPRSTLSSSSAASDVYKRQYQRRVRGRRCGMHPVVLTLIDVLGWRRFSAWLLVFLLVLDVAIPPVELPREPMQDDLFGQIPILQFIWALGWPEQMALAALFSCTCVIPWTACVGPKWASGEAAPNGKHHTWWCVIGFWIGMAGCGFRWWAKQKLGEFFTYQLSVPSSLIVAGPYRWCIHPGYAGVFYHVFGVLMLWLATATHRATKLCIMTVLLFGSLMVRIHQEEVVLESEFGQAWAAHVAPRWRIIPLVF
eukprot:TRINITY_DN18545_c0_g1_i4.p1 TRINITY_DN18545_c0_g1~~TRINITY_DN18545_c0_g1_i4.p1  ORF type:complete len:257 (+),score=42.55 TRINITY_DN18545_c0_g1_i4:99-869(+)